MLCDQRILNNHIEIIEKWIASETICNERDVQMEICENVRHADFEEICCDLTEADIMQEKELRVEDQMQSQIDVDTRNEEYPRNYRQTESLLSSENNDNQIPKSHVMEMNNDNQNTLNNTPPEIQHLIDDYNAAANLLFEFSKRSKRVIEEFHSPTMTIDEEMTDCSESNLDTPRPIFQQSIQTSLIGLFEEKNTLPFQVEVQNSIKYCQAIGDNDEHKQETNSVPIPTSNHYIDSEDHDSEDHDSEDHDSEDHDREDHDSEIRKGTETKFNNYIDIEPEQEQQSQSTEYVDQNNEANNATIVKDSGRKESEKNYLQNSSNTVNFVSQNFDIQSESNYRSNENMKHTRKNDQSSSGLAELPQDKSRSQSPKVPDGSDDAMGSSLPNNSGNEIPATSMETSDGNLQPSILTDAPLINTIHEACDGTVDSVNTSLQYGYSGAFRPAANHIPFEKLFEAAQLNLSRPIPLYHQECHNFSNDLHENLDVPLQKTQNIGSSSETVAQGDVMNTNAAATSASPSTSDTSFISSLPSDINLGSALLTERFRRLLYDYTTSYIELTLFMFSNTYTSSVALSCLPSTNQQLINNISQASDCTTESQASDCTTESQASDCTTESQATDCIMESQASDCTTESQASDCTTESQASDCRTESQASNDENLVGHISNNSIESLEKTPSKETNNTTVKRPAVTSIRKKKVSKRSKRPNSLIKLAIKNATKSRELSALTAVEHISTHQDELKNNQAISNCDGIQNEELEDPLPEENWIECVPRKLNFTRKNFKDFETPKRLSKYLRTKPVQKN